MYLGRRECQLFGIGSLTQNNVLFFSRDYFSTRSQLQLKEVQCYCICSLCENVVENPWHLFTSCPSYLGIV